MTEVDTCQGQGDGGRIGRGKPPLVGDNDSTIETFYAAVDGMMTDINTSFGDTTNTDSSVIDDDSAFHSVSASTIGNELHQAERLFYARYQKDKEESKQMGNCDNLRATLQRYRSDPTTSPTNAPVATAHSLMWKLDSMCIEEVPSELDKLMKDTENMMSYYQTELMKEWITNVKLQQDRQKMELKGRKMAKINNALSTMLQANKEKIDNLSDAHQALAAEAMTERRKASQLRRRAKCEQIKSQKEMMGCNKKNKKNIEDQMSALLKQQRAMKVLHYLHEKQCLKQKKDVTRLNMEHMDRVSQIKKDIRGYEDAQMDYLSQLLVVLEEAHASRHNEVNSMIKGFDTKVASKDRELAELQRELHKLSGLLNVGSTGKCGS